MKQEDKTCHRIGYDRITALRLLIGRRQINPETYIRFCKRCSRFHLTTNSP